MMNTRQADELGRRIDELVTAGKTTQAYADLAPILAQRTPFSLLGRVGQAVENAPWRCVDAFLEKIAAAGTEGGWVVIGGVLGAGLQRDLRGPFARCRDFIARADVWYAADILAERVPGPGLVAEFPRALNLPARWRKNRSPWVRRAVGISMHYWAKRSGGAPGGAAGAEALLALLRPMITEWDLEAAKGVGWGLKTLGRYYPDLVAAWLPTNVVSSPQRCRSLILRKSLTYLSEGQRRRVLAQAGR